MYRQQRTSLVIVAIVISMVSFAAICDVQGFQGGNGRLVLTHLSLSSDTPGLDRPPCKAPPLCYELIADINKILRLKGLSQLGILITPVNGDVDLQGLSFEIRSKDKVVFATQPINVVLKAKPKANPADAGYLFVLDKDAIEAGIKLFLPQNTIAFGAKGTGKGKAAATFHLVNTDGARVNVDGSNPNTRKAKP